MIRSISLAVAFMAFLTTSAIHAGQYNNERNIGDKAPTWKELPGVDGKKHSLADLDGAPCVVVVFTCNSCPVAVDYEDRIVAFAKKYQAEGKVAVVAINVNKVEEDSLPEMKKKADEKGFPFPYLFDETQQIAKDYGAAFTPEFFVLDKDRKIAYMGGMDDNSLADKVTENHLVPAVDAVLKGEKPAVAETVARGCRVRYERPRRTKKT